MSLRGRGRRLETMEGEGDVKITDADIYGATLVGRPAEDSAAAIARPTPRRSTRAT